MFKVGDKVVCVDDIPKANQKTVGVSIKKGTTYTIRGIYESQSKPGQVGLLLDEIQNEIHPELGFERGYDSCRFRSMNDIWSESILEKILNEVEEEALAWLTE